MSQKRETSKSNKKISNWIHYHKFILVAVIIALILIIALIYSLSKTVKSDYEIALLTEYSLSEQVVEDLEKAIARYGEDLNSDGNVIVKINQYVFPSLEDENSIYKQREASQTQFLADASEGYSVIYFHDVPSFTEIEKFGIGGFFNYNNGESMPEDAVDYENAILSWDEIKGLSDFMPSTANELMSSEEVMELMKGFRLSCRSKESTSFKSDKQKKYYESSKELYDRLVTGRKP